MEKKLKKGDLAFDISNTLLLTVISFVCLYPFLYVVMASFSDPNQFALRKFIILLKPEGFSLEAYKYVFSDEIVTGYLNTIFYVVAGTLISMILTSLGAYVLSRKGYMFRKLITLCIIFTMYFSGGLIALYLWVSELGMIDTRWSVLLPTAVSTYNMIVLRSGFDNIPESLVEAAKMDGASEFTCLTKIMMPLSKASMAVIVLFYAVSRWNEWLYPSMFLRSNGLYPLQIILRKILLTSSNAEMMGIMDDALNMTALAQIVKYATIVVSSAPILCLYPFIQKYFVAGMMLGGVKE